MVEQFVRTSGTAYLLSSGVDGVSAYEYLTTHPGSRMKIVGALAQFLRAFHAIPIADCPFHAGHELRLADARRNVETGLVDTSDFDDERSGWTAERVLSEAIALRPAEFDRVVTHGDFSLDNVLVARGRVTGCIDVGRAGVADPYQDLAILWHNLSEFGAKLQAELFRAYGIATPNVDMIRFHLCLDELF
jgi:aminoglycoside 3'-phosphotransferase-1